MIEDVIEKGELHVVKNSPIITLPVFMIYSDLIEPKLLELICEAIERKCNELPRDYMHIEEEI